MLTTPKKDLPQPTNKSKKKFHLLPADSGDHSTKDVNSSSETNTFSKSNISLNGSSSQIEDESQESTALLPAQSQAAEEEDDCKDYIEAESEIHSNHQMLSNGTDTLNLSNCSMNSRQSKRTRLKSTKSEGSSQALSSPSPSLSRVTGQMPIMSAYPPQYTTIFIDSPHNRHHHHHHHHQHLQDATNATEQIASAVTCSSPPQLSSQTEYQYQYHQLHHQQTPVVSGSPVNHHPPRSIVETTETSTANRTPLEDNQSHAVVANTAGGSNFIHCGEAVSTRATINLPSRSCLRKWFTRPSLPLVIGILALGGVACTLGGIVLGSTGLIEHSTHYLSAALLMIGIGVSLMVISGAIWRLSIPDEVDECPCYRHMEVCRTCNSPFCNNRLSPGAYHLYPEFQHRPPPPSYLTSLNECAANMGLIFHPFAAVTPQVRMNTPPPVYRSTNSLSVYMSVSNNNSNSISTISPVACNSDPNALTMSAVMGGLQNHSMTKEINYLELD